MLLQSSALGVITKPLPLQEFSPEQSLLAPLQALWPLQSLPPTHFTAAGFAPVYGAADSWALTLLARNIIATAEAKSAPFALFFMCTLPCEPEGTL